MITKKIGFIGCGNMGGAIFSGALESGVIGPEHIYVYDILPAVLHKVNTKGVHIAANNEDLCSKSDLIILCTKPQQAEEALASCGSELDGKGLISIAAGITMERLSNMTQGNPRILRIMPNTPAMVFEGASVLCSETTLTEKETKVIVKLFESIGIVEWVPEKLIDTVCGLSGGGPAYTAMFIEALADGAVKNGLSRNTAYRLAAQTCLGAAKMILDTGIHPGALKDMVTSPGGTTIEGVEALERGGLRHTLMDCINVATAKSSKL